MQRADEALYEQKGVLLRSAQGGRIVLTSQGRGRVLHPGSDPQKEPGEFGRGFGTQFDGYFRQMFARAMEQAKEFVEFAAPRPGSAVVEVGAGSGRITFDGGLAERIGAQGQLLVTDPSSAQLQVARQRAESLGLSWVRFLAAPAEELPIGSNSVDLVLGSTFLHFTDAAAAIASMARVTRPGGRVAVGAGLRLEYGPAWERALAPVRRVLQERGLPLRDPFLPQEELEKLFAAADLLVEERRLLDEEHLAFPNAEVVLGVARQIRAVSLLLRDVPESAHGAVEAEFESEMRRAIDALGPEAAGMSSPWLYLRARKPG